MPDGDPVAPAAAPPVSGPRWGAWTPPDERRAIAVGAVLGDAWRTYRRAFGPLLLMGTVLGLLGILLGLPGEVYLVRMVDSLIRLFSDIDYSNGIYDPILLRSQLEAVTRMPTGLVIATAVAGGASIGVSILGGCVLTAAAMTARTGRRVSPPIAVAAVLSHGSALVLPAVLIALGSIAVTIPLQLHAQDIQQVQLSAAAQGVSSEAWLTSAGVVVAFAIFYLSVRWGVAVPAILAERIGLRAGLRRSSHLTRGHRLRLAATIFVVGLLQALTVGLPSVVVGFAIAIPTGSLTAGIVAFAIAGVIGNALWAPVGPAVAAVAYGRLTDGAWPAAAPA